MTDLPLISSGTGRRPRPIDVEVPESSGNRETMTHLPKERAKLVERIREEIAAGRYETTDRIDEAIDRLEDELTNR